MLTFFIIQSFIFLHDIHIVGVKCCTGSLELMYYKCIVDVQVRWSERHVSHHNWSFFRPKTQMFNFQTIIDSNQFLISSWSVGLSEVRSGISGVAASLSLVHILVGGSCEIFWSWLVGFSGVGTFLHHFLRFIWGGSWFGYSPERCDFSF